MRTTTLKQVSEGAFFLFDPRLFNSAVSVYDARLATQNIIVPWGSTLDSEPYQIADEQDETWTGYGQDLPDLPVFPDFTQD